MIQYKVDVLDLLKQSGYSTYRLVKDKVMGGAYIDQLRYGKIVSWACLDKICRLTNMQPGDLVEYVPDNDGTSL